MSHNPTLKLQQASPVFRGTVGDLNPDRDARRLDRGGQTMPRHYVLSAAVLAAAIAAPGTAGAQSTVKIGMVMPMTGPLAAAGQQVLAGARLYVRQHGETVAGKRI